jgi:glycosyltransferase involved in cell wall biosynthesis
MRFSIIITSHNQRAFIREAVDSALAVRSVEAEVIVVDDASTDGSQEILRGYGDSIRFAALPANSGASAARNHGASMAVGDYFVFLDGDDALQPWALRVYERVVQSRKPNLLLASRLWFQGALPPVAAGDGPSEIRIVEYEDYMSKDRTFGPSASAMVVEREAFGKVRGWSGDFAGMEDLDLLIRLGDSGRTVLILSPTTCAYRIHAGNISSDVPRYMNQIQKLLYMESMGAYPGGRERRFQRYAVLGGHVLSWIRKGFRASLYRDVLHLASVGWPMVFASAVRKCSVALRGRRACESLAL